MPVRPGNSARAVEIVQQSLELGDSNRLPPAAINRSTVLLEST